MAVVLPVEPTLGKPKKMLDQVCDVMRLKHYSLRTEEAYLAWIKRFILFHGGFAQITLRHLTYSLFPRSAFSWRLNLMYAPHQPLASI